MIEAGMKMFANSIGDSMISLGTGNSTVDRTETPGLIFKMITYTVDPYTFPWVKKWWNTMLVFYVFVFTVACIGGAALVLLQKMSPDTIHRIAWLLDEDTGSFYLQNWLGKMVLGLLFPVITLFGVYVILQINYAVSGLITANALNAVPPTIDNLIASVHGDSISHSHNRLCIEKYRHRPLCCRVPGNSSSVSHPAIAGFC
jgi:hypothetical protein